MKVEVTSRAAVQGLENPLEPGHPFQFTGSSEVVAGDLDRPPNSQHGGVILLL